MSGSLVDDMGFVEVEVLVFERGMVNQVQVFHKLRWSLSILTLFKYITIILIIPIPLSLWVWTRDGQLIFPQLFNYFNNARSAI